MQGMLVDVMEEEDEADDDAMEDAEDEPCTGVPEDAAMTEDEGAAEDDDPACEDGVAAEDAVGALLLSPALEALLAALLADVPADVAALLPCWLAEPAVLPGLPESAELPGLLLLDDVPPDDEEALPPGSCSVTVSSNEKHPVESRPTHPTPNQRA